MSFLTQLYPVPYVAQLLYVALLMLQVQKCGYAKIGDLSLLILGNLWHHKAEVSHLEMFNAKAEVSHPNNICNDVGETTSFTSHYHLNEYKLQELSSTVLAFGKAGVSHPCLMEKVSLMTWKISMYCKLGIWI